MSKLWGGRFDKKSDPLADKFTFSIAYDYRLAKYDCIGSIAHAQMLGKQGIIPKSDAAKIVVGLKKILDQIGSGKFKYDPKAEDIHTDIQQRLKKLIGAPADKLHTARSRNDQVVLDVKLYCLDQIDVLHQAVKELQMSLYLAGIPFKLNFGFTFAFFAAGFVVTLTGLRLGKVRLFTFGVGRMRV